MWYAGKDMSSAEQGGPEGHEIRNGMFAITDQLVEDGSYEGERFGMMESDAACQTALGDKTELADNELVQLIVTLKLAYYVVRVFNSDSPL